MEEYGIDKLKEIALAVVQVGVKIEESTDEDSPKGKKFSLLQEGLPLFVFIIPKAIGFAGDAEQIRNEFHDLSEAELEELNTYIAEELDLENDKVEALIEAGLDWLESTNGLRLAVRDIIKKDV